MISKALMIAYATNSKGLRDIIGFGVYSNESKDTWTDFLSGLRSRGLKDVRMFTSDSHEGIKYAIAHIFPDTPWQRCQFHFRRNIIDKMPKKYQEGIASELNEMFDCDTVESARKKRDSIIAEYSDIAGSAMSCLDEGFEDSMTVMALPKEIRKYFRTSNHIERLNKELKRRSSVIGIFPNAVSLERLMGSVLLERNDMQSRKPVFYSPVYQKVEASVEKLRSKAKEQQQMLLAS